MKVVILCGGSGTRLGLKGLPKPMVSIAGTPLLEHLVRCAKRSGFMDFVFLNGHLAEVIEAYFGDGTALGVHITHVREPSPIGTAGAIRNARHILNEPFIVLYGDVLIDVDLAHFAAFHHARGGLGSLFVHPNDHPRDSDLVQVGADHRIVRFLSKPHRDDGFRPNLVNGGLYVLDPAAIDYVPEDGVLDWGHDIFPDLVAQGHKVFGYRSMEYAQDIGTPERLAKGEADFVSGKTKKLSRRRPKPAIFLDRDGVLNVERNGVHRPEDLELIPGVGAAIRRANDAGLPAIVITNQPDVAKGFLSVDELIRVHEALDTRLAEHGAYLDALYFCPHHPEGGHPNEVAALKIDCDCRKPKPGMLIEAARDHNLDLSRSWLIGDRFADIAAARGAGVRGLLVRTGHAGNDAGRFDCAPAHIAETLSGAIEFILRDSAL